MNLERLLTMGYERANIEDFLATLRSLGVTALLDVREIASSRRRGFAKTALRENLPDYPTVIGRAGRRGTLRYRPTALF
jgi:uncharacterized protein (DUF488 family)